MKPGHLITAIFFISFLSGCSGDGDVTIYDLKCENLVQPLGVGHAAPRFSWKMRSMTDGRVQKAFQLLVASGDSLLKEEQGDLWDSGRIESAASVMVPYGGRELAAGEVACWKVRIWDEAGNLSCWSPPAEFSIGLLTEDDWQASYIGFPTEAGHGECPQMKKSFTLDETGPRIFLHMNSLGYHEVYLNGKKVGEGVLAPAVSQFDKRSLVVTYELTALVKQGGNELMLWLSSGWYSEGLPGVTHNGPLVKAQMERVYGNHREILLVTDSTWMGRKSSYTRNGSRRHQNFCGETVDGAMAQKELQGEIPLDTGWEQVTVITVPNHEVSPQITELNRIQETILPLEIKALSADTLLIDMGKCLTGWTEIHFPALRKSQEIIMEYSDHLDDDGIFVPQWQTDRYIASGEGDEVFKNRFNYHGFRYIRISNFQGSLSAGAVRAYLIHTGYELTSGFKCSDPDLNAIHDMIQYTLRCLSPGGYLVDCPHLERLGYGGDGNASTETAQTLFGLAPLYSNWLQAWADVMREDGSMPHTAPNPYAAGGGPYWCGFIITASWKTYLNYGDTGILVKFYPTMQRWLDYVEKYSPDGLLKRWPDTDYRAWYLGDWASPVGVDQTDPKSVDLVNNCFITICYDTMKKIARVLGKTEDSDLYGRKKEKLQELIHDSFFDPSGNTYGTGTQIDLSYPMVAGVVPEELTSAVTRTLIHEIENNRGGHIALGLVGIPVFTEWAVKSREADLFYRMLKKRDYPGYLFMIDHGATTTWEHWNGERSRIHNCYNGVGSWFYQAPGGIRRDNDTPAYQKVRIEPQIPKGVTWARTFLETPFGRLSVNWEVKKGVMTMEVAIPPGIDANVVIPPGTTNYKTGDKNHAVAGDKPALVKLISGKHTLSYRVPV